MLMTQLGPSSAAVRAFDFDSTPMQGAASYSGSLIFVRSTIELVDGQVDGQGQADELDSVLRPGFFQDSFDICADSFKRQILGISDVTGSQALGNQPAGRRPSPLRATA